MCDDIIADLLEISGEECFTKEAMNSTNTSVYEMQDIYKEREPYTTQRLITGIEYIWGEAFLDKVRIAMSTDNLDSMNNLELEQWVNLVEFEDDFSTSADEAIEPTAIGCTIPDENGDSFIVIEGDIVTTSLCQIYPSEFAFADISGSLDEALVALVNCEEVAVVDSDFTELINVSESCSI